MNPILQFIVAQGLGWALIFLGTRLYRGTERRLERRAARLQRAAPDRLFAPLRLRLLRSDAARIASEAWSILFCIMGAILLIPSTIGAVLVVLTRMS